MRNAHDAELWAKMLAVVDTARGDPKHGPDSPLYRAIGFIAKSARASGLTTKKKAAEAATPKEQTSSPCRGG